MTEFPAYKATSFIWTTAWVSLQSSSARHSLCVSARPFASAVNSGTMPISAGPLLCCVATQAHVLAVSILFHICKYSLNSVCRVEAIGALLNSFSKDVRVVVHMVGVIAIYNS